MVKCPVCDAEVPPDSVYCLKCGSRVSPPPTQIPQPVELPSSLRGTAVLGKAKDFIAQNLILCVPEVAGIVVVFVVSFIGALMMIPAFMRLRSPEEAVGVGATFGVILGLILVPVTVFIGAWLTAASLELLQTGKARLTGRPIELVGERAGQLIVAAILNVLIAAPGAVWLLNWISTTPVNVVLEVAGYYQILIGLVSAFIQPFLLFFMVLIVAANKSAVRSLVTSVVTMARLLRDDLTFFFCILGYHLMMWLIGCIPVIGGFLNLIVSILLTPIIVLSALIYLKANFEMYFDKFSSI